MSSGNVGSEETENPKFLWPESRGDSHKNESKRGLARDLPVFVRMDGRLLDKEAWAASRQRGRGSAAGRTTQRGEMT